MADHCSWGVKCLVVWTKGEGGIRNDSPRDLTVIHCWWGCKMAGGNGEWLVMDKSVVKWCRENRWQNTVFFFFWLHLPACGILVPRPGIEPTPSELKHGVLTTGPPGKSWQNTFQRDWCLWDLRVLMSSSRVDGESQAPGRGLGRRWWFWSHQLGHQWSLMLWERIPSLRKRLWCVRAVGQGKIPGKH